jgi:hypothetical protein
MKIIRIEHEFFVERDGTEVALVAPFLVHPPVAACFSHPAEGGFARIDGVALCVDECVYYELSDDEEEKVEQEVYERYWLMT